LLQRSWLSRAPVHAGFRPVGVSVNVGEPGFYGQINIGDVPRPQCSTSSR